MSDDPVAVFYQQHPYPPPPSSLDGYQATWRDPVRRRAEFHLLFPGRAYCEDLDVLIAGCGTSQAVRHAMRWPQGRVVGIDVSAASLQSTRELAHRYNVGNLDIHELPIERVHELESEFDLIVSTGVLHHLADPETGLLALRSVLRHNGAAHLMIYARYGRIGVEMFQQYARLLGIGASRAEIIDLANTLAAIPEDHPIVPLLRSSSDFGHPDALADALLNPRERSYPVPELLAALDATGFSFRRWYRQAPYLPWCGAVAQSPHAVKLQHLSPRNQYAAMELFRGSMVRHSLIAHRGDEDRPHEPFGSRWEQAVPIRLPETVIIEERLPPGAAAVLINRSHSYRDLVLPISNAEKRVVMAIDGRRTVAETLAVSDLPNDRGRALYRRMWWYDQVVFDPNPLPRDW